MISWTEHERGSILRSHGMLYQTFPPPLAHPLLATTITVPQLFKLNIIVQGVKFQLISQTYQFVMFLKTRIVTHLNLFTDLIIYFDVWHK